jgi:hypothetical protein
MKPQLQMQYADDHRFQLDEISRRFKALPGIYAINRKKIAEKIAGVLPAGEIVQDLCRDLSVAKPLPGTMAFRKPCSFPSGRAMSKTIQNAHA